MAAIIILPVIRIERAQEEAPVAPPMPSDKPRADRAADLSCAGRVIAFPLARRIKGVS